MIQELIKLEKQIGSCAKVAHALGITDRHYRRIKKNENVTKTLDILIKELLVKSSKPPVEP